MATWWWTAACSTSRRGVTRGTPCGTRDRRRGAVAAAAEATEAIAAEGDASVADESRLSDDETVHSFDGAITAAVYVPIPKSAPLAMDAGWRVAASPGATALRTAQSLDSSGAPALEPADDASAASAAEGGSPP